MNLILLRRAIMKRFVILFAFSMITLFGFATVAKQSIAAVTKSPIEVRQDMRKLWEDHIVYTRNWIISEIADLPDKDAVAQRLLKNQDDIGAVVKPYYGDEAGNKLTALLKDHISLATDVVKAAKANNKDQLAEAQKKWKTNANDISSFLSSANPNWQEADLQKMMYRHLELTTDETAARLKKDWTADIKAYDENHEHMLMFSDMLTDGIAKQFPDKFAMR
jgi:hypothetical protein